MSSPIAIVAAACRLPDADTPEAFWNNLIAERISLRPPPEGRWPQHPDARVGSFLDDVRGFDAAFFGMRGGEAEVTDPQQRLLLQTAHEALERAGFAGPRRRNRRVGVFVGVGQSDYQEPILRLLWAGMSVHPSAAVGNLRNLIPARVSHVLDLSGPSLAVDTACSSSLVALHLACESLNRGECELALAGGITLNLTPTVFTVLSRAGALSPTGRIRPFAREADGIVLGEGLGVVVLERLEDALRRRAPILAVVRGSALNNDGRTFNPMAPNPARQMAVMREAWQRAGLEPASASYLEAHGTGTRVGDSIEARSVTAVFGRAGANEPLGLGSVKGNVGHLLSAAGMASLLKVVSSLQHHMLPASVHAGTADPKHGLSSAGIALVDSSRPWRGPGPLRAGINGFGFGGTNAHVILEEAPARPPRSRSTRTRPLLWTLSARTDTALRATARNLASWLRKNPEVELADAALSASISRAPGPHRLALVGTEGIPERLEAWADGSTAEVLHGVVPDRVARKKARNGASLEGASAELAASAFVGGEAFDRLAWDEDPEREHVPVPTYPFEPQPWWVPEAPPAPASARRMEQPLPVDGFEPSELDEGLLPWMREVVWHEAPAEQTHLPQGRWLIVPSAHPASHQVSRRLSDAGATCERVDPTGLKAALARSGTEGIVFLGPTGPTTPITDVASFDQVQRDGVLALLAVARAWDALERERRPARLLVVTAGATEGLAPERATVVGLGLALEDELPGSRCRVVDADVTASEEALADVVLAEVSCTAPEPDRVFRWRLGRRERRTVGPLTQTTPHAHGPRENGVYLVTGGAEGLGHAVAQRLARAGRTLILVGRKPLEHSPERAARIEALRASGAAVSYIACDIADPDGVAGLVARIVLDHGALHGVVHAAGVASPGRIGGREDAAFTRVLGPKVRGTWLLWREFERRHIRPDFFALFSSLSASWPGLGGGLGDYVAANAYLDAFALARRAEGLPFTSVAWSVWGETGMGADPTLVRVMEARGLPAIPTQQGVDAFLHVLELGRAHVVVAPMGPRVTVSRPLPAVTLTPVPTEVPSNVEEELRALVAKALEVDPSEVATDRSFLAMGLDSLNALDLAKILSDRYRVELPPTLFFEQPTIDSLAEYLRKAKGDPAPERRPAGTAPSTPPRTAVTEAPLSPVQKAFWVQQRLHPDVPAFSFVRQTVRGRLSLDALQRAADAVARRHPLLRASVAITAHGEAVQRISETVRARLIDHGQVADVEALADGIVNTPFDLSHPPLWRLDVARDTAADTTHVLLCAHHLIVDGWSLHVIAADLWRAYAATVSGRPFPDWPEAHGFFDALDVPRPRLDEDLTWWRERLADTPAPRLPFDGDPLSPPEPPMLSVLRWLDLEQTRAFTEAASAADVSVFHLSLAVHARCLARWSGAAEVVVNVARARRELRVPGIEQAVGCFADTLPLRLRLEPGEPLALLATRARDALLELERHASPTSIEIARVLPGDAGSPRVASSASYSYARIPLSPPPEVPELLALTGRTATPATRLGLAVWEFQGGLCFAWGFPERMFRKDTVERFADEHLRAHVEAGSAPRARSIPERIVARLQEAPERVALREGEQLLTRGELELRSARVAATLVERGIGPGAVVALLSDQNAQGITGLLGILRTGAAWLPLDPEHPPARLRLQLERAGAQVCLYASGAASTAAELSGAVTALAIEHLVEPRALAPPVWPGDEALAYIIFTSGSTGRPKGVPITHGSMRGYLEWALQAFGYGAEDVLLGTSSLCFDASVRQVLAPLLAGATLVCCPRALARDPERLLETVDREHVTVLSTVPSVLARLLRYDIRPLERLRWLKVGGEALPPGLIRTLHDRLGRAPPVVNLYGPTETTINATWHVVERRPPEDVERIPIGRPIGGATVHILAEDGTPCAPGVPGELHVGGRGLSSGYLGEPELTRRAFIQGAGGVRLYRTGDRVVSREDGTLDFLGRVDDQLKVHGHRIEPGEIEAVLARHPAVSLAVVRAVGNASERRLEAWIQFRDAPPTEDALRGVLREHLPEAMWPRHFHMLETLPTTVTGKVDRAALEALSGAAPARTIRGGPPRTDTEQRVADAFSRVLSRTGLGRDDDFFELGGDSMAILEVFTRLQAMGLRLPRPATLYTARTVRALAEAIDTHSARSVPEAAVARAADAEGEWFPLSPAQRGFLVAHANEPERPVRWAARLLLEGELDSALFREALGRLVERHPMLRMVVDASRRPPMQRVLEPGAPPLTLMDPCAPDELDRLFAEARRRHFDPQKEPPLALHLCRVASDRHVLLVAADHLIGDGLSGWIFVRELLQAYDGLARGAEPSLPPLRSTFRDYVRHLADRAETQEDAAFWRRTFAVPYVPPRSWYRPEGPTPSRDEVTLSPERVDALRASASRRGGTLFELVLAAWTFALRRLTGQDDLVIGTAVSGRDAPLPDVHRVFGPFATAVPLRIREVGSTPQELLESVRGVAADARAHALTPGGIARAIPGGLPLEVAVGTQFFFTFMDFEAFGSLESERLRVHWEDSGTEGHVPRGVDLKLAARRLGGALRLSFYAAPAVLGPQGLERVRADVLDVLETLAGGPGTKARSPSRMEVRFGPIDVGSLSAALVGYLPAPEEAARAVGLASVPGLREVLRSQLFPDGSPRWVERIDTPLGASGLLCLPLFADELGALAPETLAARVVEAVLLAHRTGVRAFSLAGMLPAYTGFGREVLHRLAAKDGAPEDLAFTTGHATTVVSVVRSVLAATSAAGVNLPEAELAFVGVGSIGAAAAELLLQVAAHPRRLLLCDLPRAARRMEEVATRLREQYGFRGPIETALAHGAVAEEVYRARVIVGAASTPGALAVDRLAPGAVLVDDSFPTLVDVPAARARMHTRGDVLIVGGGLLDCGAVTRTVDDTAIPPGLRPALSRGISRAGVASCQLEPLLRRMHPELPPVSGPVDAATAYRYWLVALASGLRAAPLHLGTEPVPDNLPAALTGRGNTG
ncbi:non-ribosomal peptide synthetase [Archangium lipolyticum]|uniref:non-ribosomal peptide synthetase n=1 Tax=Archangium lipolyticum TaxID=2970465 RepID=UPI00214A55F0|nr:non-ribosomal peptide synthetase [Archangium lipolyticum]